MADLLDIAPTTSCEVVKFDGHRLVVRGLNASAVAALAARFPQIIGLALGDGAKIGPQLISQFGDAIPPIIAAGCGKLGDADYEQRAGAFVFEYQIKIVAAILGLTFPNGLVSFVETLAALTAGENEGAKIHRVRLRKSRLASPPSSDSASPLNMQ